MAKILVVEDDPRLGRSVETILSWAGHQTRCASNGEEGWSLLCAESFDIVLTDIYMPDMDGIGFINQVKEEFPDQCVIAMSGGGLAPPEFVLEDAGHLGATLTLRKPFTRDEILRAINSSLEESENAGDEPEVAK